MSRLSSARITVLFRRIKAQGFTAINTACLSKAENLEARVLRRAYGSALARGLGYAMNMSYPILVNLSKPAASSISVTSSIRRQCMCLGSFGGRNLDAFHNVPMLGVLMMNVPPVVNTRFASVKSGSCSC